MKTGATYSIKDVEALQPFISTAIAVGQLTKPSGKGILASLKERLSLIEPTDQVQLITLNEAAKKAHCTRQHLYNLEKKGAVKFYKIGRCTRLNLEEFNNFLQGVNK